MNDNFQIGEYIIYVNGDRYEIGKIKSLREDGAFVWYHEGETAAKTPYAQMHKLANEYCIKDNNLGGTPMIERPEIVKCKDCILDGVCTYERGLGSNGFCNQGKRKEDED